MSLLDLRIRDAGPHDAAALTRIYLVSRRTFLDYAPLRHTDAEIHDWIAHVLIPGGGTRVVERGGRAVGFYAIDFRDGCGWLDQFYLLPDDVGQGMGTMMLASALSELVFPVRLWCFRANSRARRFYERHGFIALQFSDGSLNEEGVPDILYGIEERRRILLTLGQ